MIKYICTNCRKEINDAYTLDYGDFCTKSCHEQYLSSHVKPNIKVNKVKQ